MKSAKYLLIFMLFIMSGCSTETEEITVSAAASLTDALDEVIDVYNKDHPNVEIHVNLGGSGTLSQQIIQGAPVDLFFSASLEMFNRVVEEGMIDKEDAIPLLSNQLVWIQSKDQAIVESIEEMNKIAIGTPETVPAGAYAQQALTSQKLYDQVKDKLVFTKDVRQVLQYVESENVNAGIVYKTDALPSEKVMVNEELSIGEHDAIIYPVGIINNSKEKDTTNSFLTFLQSNEAIKIFKEYGFNEIDGDIDGSIFSTN